MTKYYVTIAYSASKSVGVEANSPQEAANKAYEMDDVYVSFCHQCSHKIDIGDPYRAYVYNEDQTQELFDDGADALKGE